MATTSKAVLRHQLLATRRAVPADVRAAETQLLCQHLDDLENLEDTVTGGTVCAYVPVGNEPGSVELLDVLLRRTERVLVPVARTTAANVAAPLCWGEYRPGTLSHGRWGLLEPPGPWLPASALTDASLVLVPALAVDRCGVRLGRGQGFYDRSLPGRNPRARLIAVVRDNELVEQLPAEPHDVPMSHALTPRGGLIALVPS